jgi:HAD superfamily hydrolase (TIGR01509 family)
VVPVTPPFRPLAVVFDLDGVLVDSEDGWARAEQRVVRDLGRPWDPIIHRLLLGRGPQDAAATLASHLGEVDPVEVARRMLVAAVDEFRRGMPARPGARELLGALRGRLPIAIATNSRRVIADILLEGAGLDGHADAVVCAEDVAAPKPAPDPYLAACAELGVEPGATVGIEDSPVGVASAVAAGLWVIGCPATAVDGPPADLSAAHVVVGSLADIPLRALLDGRAA